MKFLLDMNIPTLLENRLKYIGHECRHIQDSDLYNADDEVIVKEALKNNEVIITYDLDIGKILAFTNRNKPSVIIYRTGNISSDSMLNLLTIHFDSIRERILSGAIIIFEDNSIRIRSLPIR